MDGRPHRARTPGEQRAPGRPASHGVGPCLGQTLKKLHRELSAANHMNALRSELKEGGGVSGKDDMSISDLLRAKNLRKQVRPARRRGGEVAGERGRGQVAGERWLGRGG